MMERRCYRGSIRWDGWRLVRCVDATEEERRMRLEKKEDDVRSHKKHKTSGATPSHMVPVLSISSMRL